MIDILILLLLNSLLIFGFYNATKYDGWEADDAAGAIIVPSHSWRMILWWVRYYGIGLPDWIKKPLFNCPLCMASIHSIAPYTIYLYESGLPDYYMMLWPGYVLALSGLNAVINNFIE